MRDNGGTSPHPRAGQSESARVLPGLLDHSAWGQRPAPAADSGRHDRSGDAVAPGARRTGRQRSGRVGHNPLELAAGLENLLSGLTQRRTRAGQSSRASARRNRARRAVRV